VELFLKIGLLEPLRRRGISFLHVEIIVMFWLFNVR